MAMCLFIYNTYASVRTNICKKGMWGKSCTVAKERLTGDCKLPAAQIQTFTIYSQSFIGAQPCLSSYMVFCACFHTITDLSHYDRAHVNHKPKVFTVRLFIENACTINIPSWMKKGFTSPDPP